jgi:serine/threonine-protein kinase
VVAAIQDATGNEVAIKYLNARYFRNPEFVERFREEAALLAEIRHPNVVQLYDYIETDEGSAMVMELVPGPTLHRLLHENGRMGPEAALSVMRGSLLGLGAAHERGVVHRDYKPSNVLLNAYGISKLADFGVAERAEPEVETDPDATMPGGVGTPAYMAPEQWDGAPARPVTDIYAVTASFFECLTGKVPYSADTVYELEEKHRTAPIPLAEVPEQVQQLVAHGLAKDPAERPQDVGTFVAEVERTAAEVYGVEWEERGREDIVVMLWPLLGLFGGLGDGGPGDTGPEDGEPGGVEPEDEQVRPRRRMPDKLKMSAVVAGVAAVVMAVAAVAVAGNGKDTRQAGPPGSTSVVFTPTLDAPSATPTDSDPGAAPTAAGSTSSSSSSSSSRSSSSSSSTSGSSSSSSSSPSSKPSSKPSTSPDSPSSPKPPPPSSPASSPSSSPTSSPSTSQSTTAPISIDAAVSVVSDPPGQCVASYSVTFSTGALPNGSVDVDYTWHLASGRTVAAGPVTLKADSSQSYGTRETSNGTTTGDVFVTWTAGGSSGTSNSASVTISCLK